MHGTFSVHGRRLLTIAAAAALLASSALGAQQAATGVAADGACSYERCALGIAPTWSGLNVVRGADGTRVASLGFFWPRGLTRVFAGSDSASRYAARAVRVRRGGALLTDAGLMLLGYAAARQLRDGGMRDGDRVVAGVGAASLAASVPLQFAADGLLSRAVWWHNARFGR